MHSSADTRSKSLVKCCYGDVAATSMWGFWWGPGTEAALVTFKLTAPANGKPHYLDGTIGL
jgi:hypothetical protein